MLKKILRILFRNDINCLNQPARRRNVNLEYASKAPNLGDLLSPVIVEWMLAQKKISADKTISKTRHLLAVGSVLGFFDAHFDATVWGSGILDYQTFRRFCRWDWLVKLDVRAVRGPVTREALRVCGYQCPEIYGDPAVLLPLIYQPACQEKVHAAVLVHHYLIPAQETVIPVVSIKTREYQPFIDELVKARKVISSSLHGIILAEAYGIPAVFMNEIMMDKFSLMKIYDWYYATGRMNVRIAQNLEEALAMEPMPLPDLDEMREALIQSFPYDLWE